MFHRECFDCFELDNDLAEDEQVRLVHGAEFLSFEEDIDSCLANKRDVSSDLSRLFYRSRMSGKLFLACSSLVSFTGGLGPYFSGCNKSVLWVIAFSCWLKTGEDLPATRVRLTVK